MKLWGVLLLLSCEAWTETTLFVERTWRWDQSWARMEKTPQASLKELVRILKRSPSAKKLLRQAIKKSHQNGQTLWDVIKPGPLSLTDTTLLRKFSPHDPSQVVIEDRSKVYLNTNLNVMDGLMDLVHELTHYTLRTPFDPYSEKFDLKALMANTIEGRGGEVDAYLQECQVYRELRGKKAGKSKCRVIPSFSHGHVSRQEITQEFYKLGDYFEEFLIGLKSHNLNARDFPFLKQAKGRFVSSAYNLPYPNAVILEFESILRKVCENEKRRMKFAKGTAFSLRFQMIKRNFIRKCSPLGISLAHN